MRLNEQIGYTILYVQYNSRICLQQYRQRDVSLSTSSNNPRHFSFKGTAYGTIINLKLMPVMMESIIRCINHDVHPPFTHVMKPTPVVTSGQQLVQNLYAGVLADNPIPAD